ncbi:MAG TPA: hypothetical protein PLA50_14950, partial [Bacteroidia bacterium]|nr:hypothetical protein [Bacteroidia bacterium]
KSKAPGSDDIPELNRLRTLYTESCAPIDDAEKEETGRLLEAYLKQLEPLQAELVRAGNIDAAVAVKNEADRIRQSMGKVAPTTTPSPAVDLPDPGGFDPIPSMQHTPLEGDPFKQEKWPLKIALPPANYRIEGVYKLEGAKDAEIQLLPGSLFRGADNKARWIVGKSTLVAREVKFDGFIFRGDLGTRFYFEKCLFKDMLLGKGGAWFGGRFMSRWQFRECRIEGSFIEQWNSRHFGVQMVNCHVERVKFPSIEYDVEDEPSEVAGHVWATVRNTHFRKCVIPASVLSLLENCSFEDCRFVADPRPLDFSTTITRTVFLKDCKWEVKTFPKGFVVERKELSEKP